MIVGMDFASVQEALDLARKVRSRVASIDPEDYSEDWIMTVLEMMSSLIGWLKIKEGMAGLKIPSVTSYNAESPSTKAGLGYMCMMNAYVAPELTPYDLSIWDNASEDMVNFAFGIDETGPKDLLLPAIGARKLRPEKTCTHCSSILREKAKAAGLKDWDTIKVVGHEKAFCPVQRYETSRALDYQNSETWRKYLEFPEDHPVGMMFKLMDASVANRKLWEKDD